ncbi:hypothetical protein BLA13014_00415 [Burkholderia aenigmatica]|uniref:Uncharacterized protein n=1 Tax=Burkholderia aenigmatica TaxID=2015348 RepID=A0A6P2HF25_9BURK|nr:MULTISPECIES: hypothetical protein [Burkholderia]VWB15109.1 hypothetical protein BLA13014_00415 [Burkholderia aenigmatica]
MMDTQALDAIGQEEVAERAALADEQVQADQVAAEKEAASMSDQYFFGLNKARGIVLKMLPECSDDWTDDVTRELADALADCDAYYGWGGVMNVMKHPLLKLVAAAVPLAWSLGFAMRNRRIRAQMDAAAAGPRHHVVEAQPAPAQPGQNVEPAPATAAPPPPPGPAAFGTDPGALMADTMAAA